MEIRELRAGAMVTGLNLSAPIDDAIQARLREAWLNYGVLVFRGTGAGAREQVELSRCFGELDSHPMREMWAEGEPWLIEISRRTIGDAYVYDDKELRLGRAPWHRDTAYTPDVCRGAMLRMEKVSPQDGETMFADTAAAYDALSDDVKDCISQLEVKQTLAVDQTRRCFGSYWKSARLATPQEFAGSGPVDASVIARYPSVVHPLVITHPDSGRKCLFFSPSYLDFVIGMPQAESDALLRMLVDHTTQERFCYTHKWESNDMVLWDNRRFLHATRGYRPEYTRTGFRTTLANPMKTGRYFEEALAPA